MTHPVSELENLVRAAVTAAFGASFADADPAVHRSAFADYQADVALRLARPLKKPPLEVAKTIAEQLQGDAICEKIHVSPPGFVNFTLRRDYLEGALTRLARDERGGVALASRRETIVIDYSAPNVAKEMHVGHLRPTGIGDAIARVLGFVGHDVIRQNHIGDWGTPFGMLIEHFIDEHSGATAADLAFSALNDFYKAARLKFDAQPEFAERARQRVVLLQGGDARSLELWRTLVEASRRYFVSVYEQFGALLVDDDVRGESFYNEFLADVARELEEKGIARVDQGALCVFLPAFKGREGEPVPLIVRKSDGGYGYGTTDLAAIRFRAQTLRADRILYVVGAPQQQHFAMVFETARLAGWLESARPEHVPFGSVLGTDRKMLRTRSGESPRLVDLLNEAVQRAEAAVREKNPDLPGEEQKEVANSVGIGALKYADLSTERIKDYVFDWTRMLSFEGNTGPYLQYAHARSASILRKAADDGAAIAAELSARRIPDAAQVKLVEPAERALALELLGFAQAVDATASSLQPHRLCTYLYELATRLSAFYEACPVLRADSTELRDSRLLLCATTRHVLGLGLDLLGMRAPDRM